MEEAEQVAVLAARALSTLTAYKNILLMVGTCDCDPVCTNVRIEVIRTPVEGDEIEEPIAVAHGVGPEVWTALVVAHAQLEKAISDDAERRAEVDELNQLFNL